MLRTRLALSLAASVLLTFGGTARADSSNETAREGIVLCGSNIFVRAGGTEINWTSHSLKNLDAETPITIDRMRFFHADGSVLFDSSVSGLPASGNGLLSPGNNILGPNQTANFSTPDFLPLNLSGTKRPLTFEVTWSSEKPALRLQVSSTRIVRDYNSGTQTQGATRSRSSGSCLDIKLLAM